jgi:predicted TPR repeat methyltransferase
LYGERIARDVTKVFLEKKPISLIVEAGSYIYFGDLVPLFDSMQDGLEEGEFVVFTLENVD